jgi:hypothetical protein
MQRIDGDDSRGWDTESKQTVLPIMECTEQVGTTEEDGAEEISAGESGSN